MTVIEQIIDDEMIAIFETKLSFWARPVYRLLIWYFARTKGVSQKKAKQWVVLRFIQSEPKLKSDFDELVKLAPSPKP